MGTVTRGQGAESNRDAEAQRETVQTCKPACGLCKSAKVWNELFLTLKGKHSLMVVEHDMGFIRTISDIVTVLCDGAVLAQGTLDQVQADERVIEVYLGR